MGIPTTARQRFQLSIALGLLGSLGLSSLPSMAQTQMPPRTAPTSLPQLQPLAQRAPIVTIPSTRIPFSQRARRVIDPVSYYIGPGDEIRIAVIGYPEYSNNHSVLSDGTISLPLIGSVMAADRTPAQLKGQISRLLNEVLVNPAVNVAVSSQRPVTVNIGGSVQRPGPVQLRNLRPTGDINQSTTVAGVVSLQRPTVTAALLEAGGVTRDADLTQVQLRRYSPDQNLPPVVINLWDAISANRPARDLTLQDGDTLYVPKLAANTTIDAQLLAKSSLAPRTVRVKVVGEVTRPGEVAVPPDGNLSSAIAIAGGPTDKARMKEVTFVRRLANGQIQEQKLNLNQLTDEIQVQDGDVIYVPKTDSDKAIDVAGRVAGPLGFILRLFGL
ncbi:polysaccharide biosynthesis/export family protein [filamentous cyanobacterium LEGE 11480]|uniref:Polysaccharide biosynthesis/export family protein n=1 Tax=Romeriopsis navalis LEGE 11480 TaxID=2777977 RepID=A0A928Z2P2_9CYAN|nr:polysaccharide biosynthesis/export family protein [Romeriopsis navalis]MBE9029749.1 polysaccharide biosynthesis/export family protein [Romeriopsis navalis LEGE 11480]